LSDLLVHCIPNSLEIRNSDNQEATTKHPK